MPTTQDPQNPQNQQPVNNGGGNPLQNQGQQTQGIQGGNPGNQVVNQEPNFDINFDLDMNNSNGGEEVKQTSSVNQEVEVPEVNNNVANIQEPNVPSSAQSPDFDINFDVEDNFQNSNNDSFNTTNNPEVNQQTQVNNNQGVVENNQQITEPKIQTTFQNTNIESETQNNISQPELLTQTDNVQAQPSEVQNNENSQVQISENINNEISGDTNNVEESIATVGVMPNVNEEENNLDDETQDDDVELNKDEDSLLDSYYRFKDLFEDIIDIYGEGQYEMVHSQTSTHYILTEKEDGIEILKNDGESNKVLELDDSLGLNVIYEGEEVLDFDEGDDENSEEAVIVKNKIEEFISELTPNYEKLKQEKQNNKKGESLEELKQF